MRSLSLGVAAGSHQRDRALGEGLLQRGPGGGTSLGHPHALELKVRGDLVPVVEEVDELLPVSLVSTLRRHKEELVDELFDLVVVRVAL